LEAGGYTSRDDSHAPFGRAPRDPALMALPRWVRACDAVAVAALVLAACVLLFGGFAATLGPLRLSVRSPGRILFVALAFTLVRHVAWPAQPLHVRLRAWLQTRSHESPASLAAAAGASRVAVILVGYFAVLTVGYSHAEVGFQLSSDPILNLPARFDAGWYGGIAQDGYYFQGRWDVQQNLVFFPAFPMLMRAAGYLTGGFEPGVAKPWRLARILWGGVFISILAFVWAASYLARLARDTIGPDRAAATVALLAAYPFALYFSSPYTEGVFLLGTVGAFYHFRRREWAPAAAWGALVGLTRPNGCLLSVALASMMIEEAWRARSGERSATRRPGTNESAPLASRLAPRALIPGLFAASAPGLGMLIYSAYVQHVTGSWFGWARLQVTWGRTFVGLAPIARGLGWIQNEGLLRVVGGLPFDALNALGLLFALVLLWPTVRRVGVAGAVLVLLNVVPPVVSGGVLSMGRMTSTLFPLFLALAAIVPPRMVTPLVTVFAIGQGLAATLFFTWRPLF
jgi:mannosyltransferase PIG-V